MNWKKTLVAFAIMQMFICVALYAQELKITGVVKAPIVGNLANVGITVKGTNYITESDSNGYFQLTIKGMNQANLVFSLEHFKTQEIKVGSHSDSMIITMQIDLPKYQVSNNNWLPGDREEPSMTLGEAEDIDDYYCKISTMTREEYEQFKNKKGTVVLPRLVEVTYNRSKAVKFNEELIIVIQKMENGKIEPRGFGKIKITEGKPNLWEPGQLVLTRETTLLSGHKFEKGAAYRINKDYSLQLIGLFDLSKTNTELLEDLRIVKID